MTGIGRCCARAAIGPTAAPPSPAMNSRRRMQKVICPSRRPWGRYRGRIARPEAVVPGAGACPGPGPAGKGHGRAVAAMVVKRERSCAYVVSYVWGEPPSRFGTTLRGDMRRPCVGLGDSRTRPGGQGGGTPRARGKGRGTFSFQAGACGCQIVAKNRALWPNLLIPLTMQCLK
jgi:hypothetical protein